MLALRSPVPPIFEVNHNTTSPSAIWQVLPKMLPYSLSSSPLTPEQWFHRGPLGSFFLPEPSALTWAPITMLIPSGIIWVSITYWLWPPGGSYIKHRTSKTVGPWKKLVPLGVVSPGASPTDTAQYTWLCICLYFLPPCKAAHWKLGERNIHATATSRYWKQWGAYMVCHGNRTVIIIMVVETGIYKDKYCSICLYGLTH